MIAPDVTAYSGLQMVGSDIKCAPTGLVRYGEGCRLIGGHIRVGANASITLGSNVLLRGHINISDGCHVAIGNRTTCNWPVLVVVSENTRLTIGQDCLLSDAAIYTSDTHGIFDATTRRRVNPGQNVEIADRVWLGRRTIVLKGTRIESDVVLGAGSVAKGRLMRGSVYVGAPSRRVRKGVVWSRSRAVELPGALWSAADEVAALAQQELGS